MRSLADPKTVKKAAAAALLSTLACIPRLVLWSNRPGPIVLLLLVLFPAAYFLWSFVFGWHQKGCGRKVFVLRIPALQWGVASLAGAAAAAVLFTAVDPLAQQIHFNLPPETLDAWIATSLFTLSFEMLFVCFAPFAFFIRLFHRELPAATLTVMFGVLILCLKLSAAEQLAVTLPAITLLGARTVLNSFAVYFYLRGGILLAAWWVLLLQFRYLLSLS